MSGLPIFVGVAYQAVVRGVAYAFAHTVAYVVAHAIAHAIVYVVAHSVTHVVVCVIFSVFIGLIGFVFSIDL